MAETLNDYYTQQNKPLPTIQERAGIYEQQGLGSASAYQGTAQQNTSLLQKLQVPPPASTTISTDTLGTNPLQLPTYAPPTTPAFPMTQPPTIDEQAKQFAETQAPAPTEAEQTQTGLMSRFKSLQDKLFGKSTAQTQQEQAQGIPQKTQAVTDIQSQINQLQNEANTAKIQAQSMGETTSFGNAQIAQIERDRTVKALQLNSFLYAAQGNLATAQMMADKAVTAEFAPAEAEIAYIREALQMNEKIMTREDKKKADQLQITLNERERLLNEQKAEKKAIFSIGIEASQAGADASLLNKISQAKTQDEALQIMASDPNMRAWAEAKRAKEMQNTSWQDRVVNGQMHKVLVNNTTGEVISDLGVSELAKTDKPEVYKPPVSYQEWDLAGKPGTYADWLKAQNIKAPTQAQQTVSEYAVRIEQANPMIESLQDTIQNMNYVSFATQIKLPATFQSSNIQQYMQSARNFINAKLRRESGAVIAETEFKEARQQYLPQPGDSDKVLTQKKANRDLVYASLRSAAGNAYQSVDELLGKTGNVILEGATSSGIKFKVTQ